MTNSTTLSPLLVMLLTLLIFNSPMAGCAANTDPSPPQPKDEPYEAVNRFCTSNRSPEDTEFCIRALKSDPRSASAEDTMMLLKISFDLAVVNANQTLDHFLTTLTSMDNDATQEPLVAVLTDCANAYYGCLGTLNNLSETTFEDPMQANSAGYDILLARDALNSCSDSFMKNQINDPSILDRHRIANAYVQLCADIGMKCC